MQAEHGQTPEWGGASWHGAWLLPAGRGNLGICAANAKCIAGCDFEMPCATITNRLLRGAGPVVRLAIQHIRTEQDHA